jgi:hypothetical protein
MPKTNAPQALHAVVCQILTEEGERATLTKAAEELGVERSGYSRAVSGHNDVTVNRLQGWLEHWRTRAHAPLKLKIDADGVSIDRDQR